MQRRWLIGVLAAASLALAGCSSPPAASPSSSAAGSAAASRSTASTPTPPPPPTPSAPTSTGSSISGTGYRFTAPEGWATPTGDVGQSSTDSLVADLGDQDGFSDNLNVLVVKTGDITPDQIESQGPDQLKSAGFTKVSVQDRATIAGVESAHLTALQKSGRYRVDQFYPIRNGEGYIVTFSFSPSVSKADRDDVTRSVLSTWTWT